MMKLYYAPDTCALSPMIVVAELGLQVEMVHVNLANGRTGDGRQLADINPKGCVAALELDDGRVLTEGPAIVQYLADQKPEAGLAPANGTWERARLQEWLNFITSEIHMGAVPLFHPELGEATTAFFRSKMDRQLNYLQGVLSQQPWLMGRQFGVADAYLYTVLGWFGFISGDYLDPWPVLVNYVKRVAVRPATQVARRIEGGVS